jgi:glucose/arabinose dehydrogenase
MRSLHTARLLALALVITLASTGAACRPRPAFTTSTVVGGLDHPWDIGFLPNGTMLFTERSGRISALVGGQPRLLAAPGDVVVAGEGGMLGLAIDPQFAANRQIYTCFLSNAAGSVDVRIVRWRVNEAVTGLTNRTAILTGIPGTAAGRHTGCRPRFGPDGFLWIGTGDATVGTNPQSPTSLGGKVLRITTTGAAAPGNAGAPFRPEVYTYGHRNVQGIAFAPDGRAYAIEHGTDRDDEVNLLVPGGNYGWDPVPGYDETRPMTDLAKFPNAKVAVWSSGTPTIAPSGATFITGTQWSGWNGVLATAVLKDQQLRIFALAGNGPVVAQEWIELRSGKRLRSAVQGPDGDLYIATDENPGEILRIHPGSSG